MALRLWPWNQRCPGWRVLLDQHRLRRLQVGRWCRPRAAGSPKGATASAQLQPGRDREGQRPRTQYVAAPRTGMVISCLVGRGLRCAATVELLTGDATVNRNSTWRYVGSMDRTRLFEVQAIGSTGELCSSAAARKHWS